MAAPPRYREPTGLPIPSMYMDRTSDSGSRISQAHHDIYSSSPAMPIPGSADPRGLPPPPLPPPRNPLDNPLDHARDYHRAPSSLSPRERYGAGSISSMTEDHPRREQYAMIKPEKDEGYASLSSAGSVRSDQSLPSFGRLHTQFTTADAFTDIMKKKLDVSKTLDNRSPTSRSLLSATFSKDSLPSASVREDRLYPINTKLAMHPKPTFGMIESPGYTQTPLHSAVSQTNVSMGSGSLLSGARSDSERSPPYRNRRNNSDGSSTQGSYDAHEMDLDETPHRSREASRSEYQTAGMKRRASSPMGNEPKTQQGLVPQGDVMRRRDVGSRSSPTPRRGPPHSRNGSRPGLSLVTGTSSGLTSSFGHLSPGGLSPGGPSPIATDPGCSSPFSTPMSLNPSPRTSISSRAPLQRSINESRPNAVPSSVASAVAQAATAPRKITEGTKSNGSKIQDILMCECCPKKPKKFETQEDLNAHAAEKQYECSFCGNRFKNKNEAERHQNSLHVRRHSWSCSALHSYDRAFHDSTSRPGEADTCGYCGEEFSRNGRGPGATAPRHATDQDWEERINHLQEVHKFRECNSGKKFYRADHFRQHLKHSHAGTSGKWTNMLENACMGEEDPTPR